MDAQQRHGPVLLPWTERWPVRRKLGFGLVACIPLGLLAATFLSWLLSELRVGGPLTAQAVTLLFHAHIGAQFITLLVFGHLMIGNPRLSGSSKLVWTSAFLFLAPFAVPTYWALHVWQDETRTSRVSAGPERSRLEIHVYHYDYETHRSGVERREDGTVVHHVDAG
jgi:hypothetical protein